MDAPDDQDVLWARAELKDGNDPALRRVPRWIGALPNVGQGCDEGFQLLGVVEGGVEADVARPLLFWSGLGKIVCRRAATSGMRRVREPLLKNADVRLDVGERGRERGLGPPV